MDLLVATMEDGIATLKIKSGKVNALNETLVEELFGVFKDLESDGNKKAVVLSGIGSFFSFGFDIPEFLNYSKKEFVRYLTKFTDLYTYMFVYPKPIICALNGHAIAGGCMLALACDYRLMTSEKAKISLNEISFGATVLAGSVEMLRFLVGSRNATRILYSGSMYSAQEAEPMGLVDRITSATDLMSEAKSAAIELGEKNLQAFKNTKSLLRKPVAKKMRENERKSIAEFVDIWYSEHTWNKLTEIQIH